MADQTPEPDNSTRRKLMLFLRSWAASTSHLYELMREDFEFVNGVQANRMIERKLAQTGRELLYFNEIRPQFELLSGYRSNQKLDYVPSPRNREDKRLSTVSSAVLKATYDVINKDKVVRKAADDGDVGGLGAVHFGHSFDFSEDVVWGDIFMERISPFSFVWDAWGTSPRYQDGKFMGHRWWMHEDEYKKRYGKAAKVPGTASDWVALIGGIYRNDYNMDIPEALTRELVNAEKRHVSVFRIYYKEPFDIYFVADGETGDVYEGGFTKADAEKKFREQLVNKVNRTMGETVVTPQNDEQGNVLFLIIKDGSPIADESGQQPLVFQSEEAANEFITSKKREIAGILSRDWRIWTRKRYKIKWAELSAFEVLKEGTLPATTLDYPYEVYISRHLGEEIENIEGIVRQIKDRQREITKRYNHLADHLAHAAHSGFFNKKGEGADTKLLRLLGTQPGIVAEYNTVMPTKIEPSQIPTGHFALLDANIGGMQRSTGINAELLGLTGSSAVSGQAIEKRQAGGMTMQQGRLQNYFDFEKALARQMLHLIQHTMPVEKMRRILGVWEARTQSGTLGLHPVTGEPINEEQILDLLATMKNTKFDLILKPMASDQSVREKQFMTAMQMMKMVTATGRPIGPETFRELANLSELPERLVASLEADAQAAAQQAQAEAQNTAIGDGIKSQQAREGPNA